MFQVLELFALAVVLSVCLSLLVAHALTGAPTLSAGAAEQADIVALLRQGGLADRAIVYDLGCGWGAQLVALARAFPDAQIRGIELSPFPCLVAWLRTRSLPNVAVRWGDVFRSDLRDAQAITCYLMPGPMPRLAAFLDGMIAPGALVVALAFWFRDRRPAATRGETGLRGAAALYVWPARRVLASA
jgi:hypothetical protein